MSDSAEYWHDVKSHKGNLRHVFTHIKGIPCGHYHIEETKEFRHIDCKSCQKIVAEMGNIFNLDMRTHKEYKEEEKKKKEENKCSCGSQMKIRTNSKTDEKFLGCQRYPKCKNTKPLIKTLK